MLKKTDSKGRFFIFRIVRAAVLVWVFSVVWQHEISLFRQIAYRLYIVFPHRHARE